MMIMLMWLCAFVSQPADPSQLRNRIQERIASVDGFVAVAFHDMATGRQVLINEREMFHAASTMKTPVMIELFQQARNGIRSLDDTVLVKNTFASIVDGSPYSLDLKDDSDDSIYARIGTRMTVRELIRHMIVVSSNLATNILIELAGAENVTRSMRTLGADSILVLRGVEDGKAFEQGLNNRTSAYDLLMVFRALAGGSLVSTKACEEMLDILDDQAFQDGIPAGLPPGTKVAHKTGTISGVEHDGGIVFLPDGKRYVLIVLSAGLKERESGKKAIADISRMVYDFMVES